MRYKEFWIALGIGALTGGIAALLYAPQSGVSTRKKLKHSLSDAEDALEEAGAYLKKQAEYLGLEAQKLMDGGKEKFDATLDSANDYASTATRAAKRLV